MIIRTNDADRSLFPGARNLCAYDGISGKALKVKQQHVAGAWQSVRFMISLDKWCMNYPPWDSLHDGADFTVACGKLPEPGRV